MLRNFKFFSIGNDNPPLSPPKRGIEKSPPGRGKGWVHSRAGTDL